jgi:hypothetical protein
MANDIVQAMTGMVSADLYEKEFSTGSKGFFTQSKITVGGVRYQAQTMAVLIGSKQDPTAKVTAPRDEVANAVAKLVRTGLEARDFSSGKHGYRAAGKIAVGEQRFQVSAQAVALS